MAIDLFANNASATVSSGGTTAPAAGTSESWTLSSIVGLVASSSASIPTQMRVVDPAAPSEVMLLTNLSGTAATVTRAIEGTTSVAHSAGFTIQAVATAVSLSNGIDASSGWHPAAEGYLAWNDAPDTFGNRTAPLGSGQMSGAGLVLSANTKISNITFAVGSGGSGYTTGQNFAALYDIGGNLLAQTNDISAAVGSGLVTVALATPYTGTVGQYVRVAFIFTATTLPQLISRNANYTNAASSFRMARCGNSTFTSPPSTANFSTTMQTWWVALS